MVWVPEKDRDTSYYIFNEKYYCSVPHIDMRSSDHLRMFGMPSCGIKEIDNETAHERIDTYISIAQMAEYHKRGARVAVKKPADTKKIYERISDHLNAWKDMITYKLNIGDAPYQDLILLDQLANAIYEHAKYQFTTEYVDSLLLRQIDSMAVMTRDSLIATMHSTMERKKNRNTPKELEVEEVKKPERTPMTEFFEQYQGNTTNVSTTGRNWK